MAPEHDVNEKTEAYSLSSGRRNALSLECVTLFQTGQPKMS